MRASAEFFFKPSLSRDARAPANASLSLRHVSDLSSRAVWGEVFCSRQRYSIPRHLVGDHAALTRALPRRRSSRPRPLSSVALYKRVRRPLSLSPVPSTVQSSGLLSAIKLIPDPAFSSPRGLLPTFISGRHMAQPVAALRKNRKY